MSDRVPHSLSSRYELEELSINDKPVSSTSWCSELVSLIPGSSILSERCTIVSLHVYVTILKSEIIFLFNSYFNFFVVQLVKLIFVNNLFF
jgi:hypothetical protein